MLVLSEIQKVLIRKFVCKLTLTEPQTTLHRCPFSVQTIDEKYSEDFFTYVAFIKNVCYV